MSKNEDWLVRNQKQLDELIERCMKAEEDKARWRERALEAEAIAIREQDLAHDAEQALLEMTAERDNLQRLHEAKPSIAVRCLEAERERDEYRAALAANGLLGRGAMSEALGADDE